MKILFVTNREPYPPVDGGRQRSNLLYRALRSVGEVDMLVVDEFHTLAAESKKVLAAEYGAVGIVRPLPASERGPLRWMSRIHKKIAFSAGYHLTRGQSDFSRDPVVGEWIDRRLSVTKYDVYVSRYLSPAVKAGLIGLRPLIVDIDDLPTDIYHSRMTAPGESLLGRMVGWNQLRQLRPLVDEALRHVDHGFVTNVDDQHRLEGKVATTLMPNIPFLAEGEAPPDLGPADSDSRTVLFVGALGYRVNERAVNAFIERSWPRILAAVPDAKLRIVGSGMYATRRKRWSVPGVEPVGFVDSVRDEYARCALSVVPIFEGGGTKIKVPESLMFERAVVVSRHAYRGYESLLPEGKAIAIADDHDALATRCIELLNDPNRRNAMAAAGRAAVLRELTFPAIQRVVEQTLHRVVGAPVAA